MKQKHDDRRERLGAYPRVDARPDLSEMLEDQYSVRNNEADRNDRTDENERGFIPSYKKVGEDRRNADHGEMGFAYVLQRRRKGAIRV
jgi:hypothetical protein